MNAKDLLQFSSLAEAQAYEVKQQKLISADQMRIFMINAGIYSYVKESTEELLVATYDNLASRGEFNFIDGHNSNISGLIDLIASNPVHADKASNFATLKMMCVGYCNEADKPYENATSDDWDKAQLMVNPTKKETQYQGGDKLVLTGTGNHVLAISIDTPFAHDDELTVTAQTKPATDGSVYADSPVVRARHTIPANYTGTHYTLPLNLTGLSRHVKLFVQSKYNRNFESVVLSVS